MSYKEHKATDFRQIHYNTHTALEMDTRFTLVAVLLYIFTAEVQLASSQLGNFSLPVTYPVKVLEGGEQICPTQGQLEMARMLIKEEIQDLISTFGQEQRGELSFS